MAILKELNGIHIFSERAPCKYPEPDENQDYGCEPYLENLNKALGNKISSYSYLPPFIKGNQIEILLQQIYNINAKLFTPTQSQLTQSPLASSSSSTSSMGMQLNYPPLSTSSSSSIGLITEADLEGIDLDAISSRVTLTQQPNQLQQGQSSSSTSSQPTQSTPASSSASIRLITEADLEEIDFDTISSRVTLTQQQPNQLQQGQSSSSTTSQPTQSTPALSSASNSSTGMEQNFQKNPSYTSLYSRKRQSNQFSSSLSPAFSTQAQQPQPIPASSSSTSNFNSSSTSSTRSSSTSIEPLSSPLPNQPLQSQ